MEKGRGVPSPHMVPSLQFPSPTWFLLHCSSCWGKEQQKSSPAHTQDVPLGDGMSVSGLHVCLGERLHVGRSVYMPGCVSDLAAELCLLLCPHCQLV